jgi:glycosyltransferase involved in cell wall biosynthesis
MATGEKEWIEKLIKLIDDVNLRRQMGLAGRKTVVELFSVKANYPKYLQAFKNVIPL